MSKLQARKSRGKYKCKPLFPHKYKKGTYVASYTRRAIDYVRVKTEAELVPLVKKGYGVRMSNPEIEQAPSLISSNKITITEDSTTVK